MCSCQFTILSNPPQTGVIYSMVPIYSPTTLSVEELVRRIEGTGERDLEEKSREEIGEVGGRDGRCGRLGKRCSV